MPYGCGARPLTNTARLALVVTWPFGLVAMRRRALAPRASGTAAWNARAVRVAVTPLIVTVVRLSSTLPWRFSGVRFVLAGGVKVTIGGRASTTVATVAVVLVLPAASFVTMTNVLSPSVSAIVAVQVVASPSAIFSTPDTQTEVPGVFVPESVWLVPVVMGAIAATVGRAGG